MTPPTFDGSHESLHAAGPVTCATCGCRLQPVHGGGSETWFHFSPMGGRDARGCRIDCAELPHDAFGRALADVAAA